MLKHVGKMKHNGAKVCVIYRTLPGDAFGSLVVGTASLSELYHNQLMSELESPLGQQANELGDHISNRYFQDGTNMLEQLHRTGKFYRVNTSEVIMTPVAGSEIPLDELNLMIAEQKGVTLDDLAIKADMPHVQRQKKTESTNVEIKDLSKSANESKITISDMRDAPVDTVVPKKELREARDYRSEADRLYKEAARLKKIADEMDPPKKRSSAKTNKETT